MDAERCPSHQASVIRQIETFSAFLRRPFAFAFLAFLVSAVGLFGFLQRSLKNRNPGALWLYDRIDYGLSARAWRRMACLLPKAGRGVQ
jgi:hypothetical protein